MTETEIKEIVQKQRSYFYTGATLPVEKRLDALKKLKTCIQNYEPLINEALKRVLGKVTLNPICVKWDLCSQNSAT